MKRIQIFLGIALGLAILCGVFHWHGMLLRAMNTLAKDVFRTRGFYPGIRIVKYPGNYACFKFETADGIKIVTDPYHIDEKIAVDVVTESHQHPDHNNRSQLLPPYRLILTPGDFTFKNIRITGISGKHDKGDAGVTNIMYLFDLNGIKIAHLASQGVIPELETLKKLAGVDILMIQGFLDTNYTGAKMSPEECCQVIERVHPKIVIPEHGQRIEKDLANHFHQTVRYQPNGELIISKDELAAIHTLHVVVLDRNE